jgi:xeroderma pigmentosum group C-complementing protein
MARVKKTSAPGRASAKEKTSTRTKVPDIYNEMLADTVASASQINDEGKIVKRRRVAGRMVVQSPGKATTDNGSGADEIEYEELTRNPESTTQQTTYNESDDSSEIDLNWEEVDLQESFVEDNNSGQHDNQNDELSLVLNQDTGATRGHGKNRKVPITAAERQLRVDTHKMHLLCLLVHIHIRNHWCNDGKVHVGQLYLYTKEIKLKNPSQH